MSQSNQTYPGYPSKEWPLNLSEEFCKEVFHSYQLPLKINQIQTDGPNIYINFSQESDNRKFILKMNEEKGYLSLQGNQFLQTWGYGEIFPFGALEKVPFCLDVRFDYIFYIFKKEGSPFEKFKELLDAG